MTTLVAVFIATAYCCVGTGGGYCGKTASGTQVGAGQIAADPYVLPLGTRVYVDGYGPAVVTDTGGAIKGRIIDVYYYYCTDAWSWGTRSVTVRAGGTLSAATPPPNPAIAVERAVYEDAGQWIEVVRWRDDNGREWDTFTPVPAPAPETALPA